MTKRMNRRKFIQSGAVLGSALMMGGPLSNGIFGGNDSGALKFVSVKSGSRIKSVEKAVATLGGMGKIVANGAKVGLLINAPTWWKKKGSFVHPDVVLPVIRLCFEAGAKEVQFLLDPPGDYFNRTNLKDKFSDPVRMVKRCSGNYVEKEIRGAVALKKADIIREIFECDTFINIPIFKHHAGTHISCNLKNMMGLNTHSTNRFFHHGSGAKGGYDDVKFLSQCVADLNTVRKPDLCVMDATEFLGTGGPAGPGLIMRADRVIAGTDPVAIDSYSSSFLKHKPGDILMIQTAGDRGLGEVNYKNLNFKEVTI